ncbi:MAG TPA: hypothetical protein VHE81_17385 [Lacipirellulaceae bacterium]|nr:hypothetical protein [Lacipirellulaceae bacterium]
MVFRVRATVAGKQLKRIVPEVSETWSVGFLLCSEVQEIAQRSLHVVELPGRECPEFSGQLVPIETGEPLDIYRGRLWEPAWVAKVDLAPLAPDLGRERGNDHEGAGIVRIGVG